MLKIIYIFFCYSSFVFAQNFQLTGLVKDRNSNTPLSFANVILLDKFTGTAANQDGQFNLSLPQGKYNVVASYIGYKSDTLQINLNQNKRITFFLEPVEIKLEEVVVNPNTNPAYGIIKQAIKRKNLNKELINSYTASSYSKGLIKTTKDFVSSGFSISTKDTGDLKITGILENESRILFKKPDLVKHFIVARKQTANTPPFINILTGGLLIQSFYENELVFFNKKIPSPISNNATDYYYYYVESELYKDNRKIYKINFSTDNPAAPGFFGKLFIEDSTFYLLKAEVNLNRMANPGGLFNYVKVFQQFSVFDSLALPVDYRIFTEGNYLGLAKFGFELHTIMNDYQVNIDIDDDLFDSALLTVLPEADKKDKNYWKSIQSIPSNSIEQKAYQRIDSLQQINKTFGQDFSFLSPKFTISDNISISGPASIYSFNKVEGNKLNFDVYYSDAMKQRLNITTSFGYGFADKQLKHNIYGQYLLGDYRTTNFSFGFFNKTKSLFENSNSYNQLTSTLLSLFTKYDFRHYYYSKGFYLSINSEVSQILQLGIGYYNQHNRATKNKSDFSFFYRDREYPQNKQVSNINLRALNPSFKLDFRKFIEDGFFRRRLTPPNYLILEGELFYSSKDLLNSDLDFTFYLLSAYGSFVTAGNWNIDYSVNKFFSKNSLPLQYMYSLPGNINGGSKNNSFRTLGIGEIFGDEITTIFLTHNFSDNLFNFLNVPYLRNFQIQFSSFINIAIADVDDSNLLSDDLKVKRFTKPFYEAGFSIGHPLIPIKIEFTWKLNYREKNNFTIGLNTVAF